ncbi:MAG: hypothetical protein RLZZ123_839 [Pseudomonadota bacterium]|jgi:hypothetical protein
MQIFSKNYVAKSFGMGFLGILGTLVACGGGGVTSTVAQSAAPSEQILFAMGFQPTTVSGDSTVKWKSTQGGKVYVNSGGNGTGGAGNWAYGGWGTWNQTDIDTKGWVGVQFNHPTALNSADYIYYKVTAPKEGSVDISATDSLIISLGNEKIGSEANTPTEVTIFVEGGTLDTNTWTYANTCKTTQSLRSTTLQSTYVIALSSLTCTSGTLAALKSGVKAVEVKVLAGGGNATGDASTTANYVLIQLGAIAFGKNNS